MPSKGDRAIYADIRRFGNLSNIRHNGNHPRPTDYGLYAFILFTPGRCYFRTFNDIEIRDISLEDYIAVKGKYATYLPHTAGRYQKKRFRKATVSILGVGGRVLFFRSCLST